MTQPFFWAQTKEQLAWAGHTPGLPWPFQYVEVPVNPTYVNAEYAPSPLLPSTGVLQIERKGKPIIGDFQSVVYDVPYDSTASAHPAPFEIGALHFREY